MKIKNIAAVDVNDKNISAVDAIDKNDEDDLKDTPNH